MAGENTISINRNSEYLNSHGSVKVAKIIGDLEKFELATLHFKISF